MLPFQPNANLVEFDTDANGKLQASIELSNVGPFVTKASHFSVYDNRAGVRSFRQLPRPSTRRPRATIKSNTTTQPRTPGSFKSNERRGRVPRSRSRKTR